MYLTISKINFFFINEINLILKINKLQLMFRKNLYIISKILKKNLYITNKILKRVLIFKAILIWKNEKMSFFNFKKNKASLCLPKLYSIIYKSYVIAKNITHQLLIINTQKQRYLLSTFMNFIHELSLNKNNKFFVLSNSSNDTRLINNSVLSEGKQTIVKERLPLIPAVSANYTRTTGLVFLTNITNTLKKEIRKSLLPETSLNETISKIESSFPMTQFQQFKIHNNMLYLTLKTLVFFNCKQNIFSKRKFTNSKLSLFKCKKFWDNAPTKKTKYINKSF